jgi:dynein heavy chain
MGGAPAGPAGTGKTETTKDLGRALGLQVVVFNCSPQMTYLSMAQIFMGLSQAGAWGCFDEFNRIDISVLSVVSTQVKYCLDHIKVMKADPSKIMFKFGDEEEIPMRITSGFFITMNPGYAGRTELPENLKALFRSCAMVVPDIILICENMLMSEGFQDAKILSTKFMELYTLCASLLSKQRHYDWGLRAVKSVLRQAGQLKRASPDDPELLILMRALRDFNTPKIVIDDIPIFMGLIKDLFPGLDPEVIVDPKVKEACEHCARDPDYLPLKQLPGGGKMDIKIQEKYIEKCVELYDLLTVRHSVFIIGFPGSAKSSVWQLLARGCTHMGRITAFEIVDPKCVSTNELFGYMNPKTKEWRDGVLSTMMRDMSKCQGKFTQAQQYKWVVLDGDVDPMWIESCNTVMDDNKMLTLVSQERIPLSPAMRLILEVSHLKYATPATVSRGGVLFINENDIGWKPHWDSWVEKFKREKNMISEVAYNTFMLNLATYLDDGFIDDCKRKPTIAPMCTMAYVQSLICILDFCYEEFKTEKIYTDFVKKIRDQEAETMSRLGPNAADFDTCLKQIFEGMFVFALTWSFGAAFTDDKIWFSGMMRNKCKVKIPEAGLIYDYRFDILSISWIMWSDGLAKMDPNFEGLYSNLIVPTVETRRQSRLIEIHTP